MRQLLYRLLSKKAPAWLWTIIIFILLALPGNMLPNENHLAISNLDKYVHITLFGTFVYLWTFYYASGKTEYPLKKSFLILIIACLYGTAMEFVQKYFIPNRDYDIYDILADVMGAIAGFLIVRFTFPWFKKG